MKRNYNINNNLNFSEMEAKNNAESLNSDYPESPLSLPEETNPPKQDVLLASL